MGNCSSTSNCNPCGPDFSAINQLATKAGAYARQANTYSVDAQNAWLEFNALYLGAFAVAPTVDNEGDPLQTGALYWNTATNMLYAWNGVAWVVTNSFNQFTPFIATGTTFARNLVTREADVVNVKDFGAVGDGIADDTAAIQAAFNSLQFLPTQLRKFVYFPQGRYNFTQLTLPVVVFYCLYGDGTGSVLVQKGNGIKYAPLTALDMYAHDLHATIRDLHFDGTDGTGNTLDLTYSQTTDVVDVYFTNIPQGFSALKLDGNPLSGVYSHDFSVKGIRIYNRYDYFKQGFAGIHLGSRVSDSIITEFVMQGYNIVDYCVFADAGASTTQFSDSHIFNATKSVLRLDGFHTDISFTNMVFDWSDTDDLVYLKQAGNTRFVNCQFQIRYGWGVTLDNSYNTLLLNCKYNNLALPINGIVREINIAGEGRNRVVFAQIEGQNATTNLFSLNSATSYATGFVNTGLTNANWPTQTYFGSVYSLNGNTQLDQAQNTTQYLGQNGRQTFSDQAQWSVPIEGYIKYAKIVTNQTPAAGQTFTFNLYKGATLVGSAVINNGSFSATITPATSLLASVVQSQALYIESVFSLTSGPSYVRYNVVLTG